MQTSGKQRRCKLFLLAFVCGSVLVGTWKLNGPHGANSLDKNAGQKKPAIPKVALLFLTRGAMPLEPAWRDFMEAAAALEPIHPETFIAWGDPAYVHKSVPNADAQSGVTSRHMSRKLHIAQQNNGLQLAAQHLPEQSVGSGPVPGGIRQQGEQVNLPEEESGNGSEGRMLREMPEVQRRSLGNATKFRSRELTGTHVHADITIHRAVLQARRWAERMQYGDDVIARQSLFSVYVHTAPGYEIAPSNLFYGYQIADRTVVQWGQFSVADAEKRLLRAALEDPLNERFLLLSEACLPLYPPHVLYTQLMYERRSRINACADNSEADMRRRAVTRWDPAMRTTHLTRRHWRKSSQWFTLSRQLAAVVAQDKEVAPVFEVECFSYLPDTELDVPPHVQDALDANITIDKRECVADEHYVPTLLAMHGLESKTDCLGALMHTEWAHPMWSPKTFHAFEITQPFVKRLREKKWFQGEGEFCQVKAALQSADALFRRMSDGRSLASVRGYQGLSSGVDTYAPLDQACALFARKFDAVALDAVLRLGMDCQDGFGWSSVCVHAR